MKYWLPNIILSGQSVPSCRVNSPRTLDCLTLKHGTRNVGDKPIYAEQRYTRANIRSAPRWQPEVLEVRDLCRLSGVIGVVPTGSRAGPDVLG